MEYKCKRRKYHFFHIIFNDSCFLLAKFKFILELHVDLHRYSRM